MSRYDDQILDEFGRPVPGVSIYVYDDAGALDTLTADDASPLANPVTSDADGLFYFNAADGEKLLDFRFGGRTRYKQEIFVGALGGAGGGSSPLGTDVTNFYSVGTRVPGVTDDLAAWEACRDFILQLVDLGFTKSGIMWVPAGRHRLSDKFETKGIDVVGEGSGQPFGFRTLVRCDKAFIRLSRGVSGGYSRVEGIQAWGPAVSYDGDGLVTDYSNGFPTAYNGIELGCDWGTCIDVACYFFTGDAFPTNSTFGNCNSVYLERCQGMFCRGSVYSFVGSDANAGSTNNCSAIECGGSGIIDYAFLTNKHNSCHVRDCGVSDPTGGNGPVGSCLHGGVNYAVRPGKEVQASTEEPGTVLDATAAWVAWPGYSNPTAKPWVTGDTWIFARPICTNVNNEGNGRGIFDCPYIESAQAPVIMGPGWAIDGGVWQECGVDPYNRGTIVAYGEQATVSQTFRTFDQTGGSHYASFGEAGHPDTLLLWYNGTNTYRFRKSLSGAGYSFDIESTSILDLGTPAFNNWTYAARARLLHISDADGDINAARLHAQISNIGQLAGKTLTTGDTFHFTTPLGYKGVTALATGVNTNNNKVAPYGKIGWPVNDATAARTLAITDMGCYLRFTNAGAVTLTVPPNSAVAFPIGTEIDFVQAGGGSLTVAAGVGVTVDSFGADLVMAGQWAGGTLKKVDTDTWDLHGKLS